MMHQNLDAWKKSMDLLLMVYELTKKIPTEEKYGLTAQIRKCVVSIPSNIAEGAARKGDLEFIQFLYISLGSHAELETQLYICEKLGFFKQDIAIKTNIVQVKQLILGLIKHLKSRVNQSI